MHIWVLHIKRVRLFLSYHTPKNQTYFCPLGGDIAPPKTYTIGSQPLVVTTVLFGLYLKACSVGRGQTSTLPTSTSHMELQTRGQRTWVLFTLDQPVTLKIGISATLGLRVPYLLKRNGFLWPGSLCCLCKGWSSAPSVLARNSESQALPWPTQPESPCNRTLWFARHLGKLTYTIQSMCEDLVLVPFYILFLVSSIVPGQKKSSL